MAVVYRQQGDLSKALESYQEALSIYKVKYGVSHKETKDAERQVAMVKELLGKGDSSKTPESATKSAPPSVSALATTEHIPGSLQGYFEKKKKKPDGHSSLWQKRWFILNSESASIAYYEDETLKSHRGEISLPNCNHLLDLSTNCVRIATPDGVTYKLRTSDTNQLNEWNEALNKMMTRT